MSRSVIRDGDRILKEILKLVSEGYVVSFRPDIEDAFQIRMQKDIYSVAYAITNDKIRLCTACDAEDVILCHLWRLRNDLDNFIHIKMEEDT